MIYDILWGNNVVGQAEVIKMGLFYQIRCRDNVFKPHGITLQSSSGETDLGICFPVENGFGFCVNIPIKQAGKEPFTFVARAKKELFVPVKENEPFGYIAKLSEVRMQVQDNEIGVILQYES